MELLISVSQFSSVQSLSRVRLFATPWTVAHQASLSITNSWSLLKLMSIKLVMSSNHLMLCWPLRLLSSIFPSIRVFCNKSVLRIRWSKYWSFSFSISPSNEYSWPFSLRIDWFNLFAVLGLFKSLLQHHSSKPSIFQCSAFLIVQLFCNGNPLQYSCLENPMDGGAWWAIVHGFAKSRTQLTDFPFTFDFHALEKEMATHSSVLAWRIPGKAEPGGLPSMWSHRVGHYWSDLAAAAAHPYMTTGKTSGSSLGLIYSFSLIK